MKLTHYINDTKRTETDNVNVLSKKNSKKYEFFLDNITNNIYITDRLIFIRESDEYKLTIEIGKKNTCFIYLKDKDINFEVKVIDAKYNINDNKIDIEYILETDDNKHKLVLETEE